MKNFIKIFLIVLLTFLGRTFFIQANDITKDITVDVLNAPTVTTTACSSIGQTSFLSGGNITSDGGSAVTSRGIVWSTSTNPTISLSTKTNNGTGTGNFSSSATPLNSGTIYYVRAYATNSVDTGYGNEITCTTLAVPTLVSIAATSISQTSASLGTNVTSLGIPAVISVKGVCWGVDSNPSYPTTAGTPGQPGVSSCVNNTITGLNTGSFSQGRSGMTCGTTYHYRGYAVNTTGVGYSPDATFTTLPCTPGIPTATPGACGTGSITLSWTGSTGVVTGYQLRDGASGIYDNTATSFIHTGLSAGSSHSYTVRSKNLSGYSPYTSSVSATAPIACAGNATLTVTKEGSGTVTSEPAGISCGADCDQSYTTGTYVELTAAPASGSVFAGWVSDDCNNTVGKCSVTMDKSKTVKAVFKYVLTVTKTDPSNSATITSTPTGISCGADCNEPYASGTNVTINAPAVSGYSVAISNGCTATGAVGVGASCSVTMDAAKTVSVVYAFVSSKITPTCTIPTSTVTYNGSPQYPNPINMSTNGSISDIKFDGSNTIPTNAKNSYAITIDFTPTDTTTYNSLSDASCGNFTIAKANQSAIIFSGQTITNGGSFNALSATGGSGTGAMSYSVVTAGTAGCSVSGTTLSYSSSSGQCSIRATRASDTNYNVATRDATFTVNPSATPPSTYRLTLVKNGTAASNGQVTWAASGNQFNTGDYAPGTPIDVVASIINTSLGTVFAGWSGCDTLYGGGSNPPGCRLTTGSTNRTITATFNSTSVPPATDPVISSFSVTDRIIIGGTAVATWNSAGATSCKIRNAVTQIDIPGATGLAVSGSHNLKPTETTTYELVCTNGTTSAYSNPDEEVIVINPNYIEN